ncbi:unnamed protein product [Urochloa humidicola]
MGSTPPSRSAPCPLWLRRRGHEQGRPSPGPPPTCVRVAMALPGEGTSAPSSRPHSSTPQPTSRALASPAPYRLLTMGPTSLAPASRVPPPPTNPDRQRRSPASSPPPPTSRPAACLEPAAADLETRPLPRAPPPAMDPPLPGSGMADRGRPWIRRCRGWGWQIEAGHGAPAAALSLPPGGAMVKVLKRSQRKPSNL